MSIDTDPSLGFGWICGFQIVSVRLAHLCWLTLNSPVLVWSTFPTTNLILVTRPVTMVSTVLEKEPHENATLGLSLLLALLKKLEKEILFS